MTKSLLLAFLIVPFIFVGVAKAQGVSVNQQGDVVYLGTTTTTTTTTIATPTPTPTSNTIVLEQPNQGTTVYLNGTSFVVPPGYFPDFTTMTTTLLQVALIASVILVLFQLVSAGINWISSGGDKGKTDSARDKIVAAIIGLVLVVASWAIFLFILKLIGIAPSSIVPFAN